MNVKKAVITAAARGERLYPVADTIQKTMLPLLDIDGINKPMIQIIAEEAFSSGIEEICMICAPGDPERYVEGFQSLRSTLTHSFKYSEWAQQQIQNINKLLDRLTFKVQDEPLGYGHAVYQAKSFVNNEPFLLLLGDYIYISDVKEKRCAQQLIELAQKEDCSVSAVKPTIEHLINRYGTLTGKALLSEQGAYQIEKIIEKPSISDAELYLQTPGLRAGFFLCFSGMHVFKPSLFDMLEEEMSASKTNVLLTPVLQRMAELDKYLALELKGNRYDTSKRYGLFQAQLALSMAGSQKDEVLTDIIQIMADATKRSSL